VVEILLIMGLWDGNCCFISDDLKLMVKQEGGRSV